MFRLFPEINIAWFLCSPVRGEMLQKVNVSGSLSANSLNQPLAHLAFAGLRHGAFWWLGRAFAGSEGLIAERRQFCVSRWPVLPDPRRLRGAASVRSRSLPG